MIHLKRRWLYITRSRRKQFKTSAIFLAIIIVKSKTGETLQIAWEFYN